MLPNRTYVAKVESIKSVDEMTAMVDLGHDGLYKKTKIRLYKVMAPPASKEPVPTEVMDELCSRLLHKPCEIAVHYRRGSSWIVSIVDTARFNINDFLIERGYALSLPINEEVEGNA